MGFISGFGTGFAALIAVLAASIMPMAMASPQPVGVSVELMISGLRSGKGNVLVCLTANPKFFPDCGKDPRSVKQLVAARQGSEVRFDGVAPGTYAVALIHDENANNKMDTTLFIPKEGFGFSRNPAIGMGPPKFSAAQFTVAGENMNLPVKVKYML